MTKLDLAREGKALDVLYETSDQFGMIELADGAAERWLAACDLVLQAAGRASDRHHGHGRGGAGGYGAEGQPIVIEAADLPAVIDLVAGVGPELQQEHRLPRCRSSSWPATATSRRACYATASARAGSRSRRSRAIGAVRCRWLTSTCSGKRWSRPGRSRRRPYCSRRVCAELTGAGCLRCARARGALGLDG